MTKRSSVLDRLLTVGLVAFVACIVTIVLAARAEFNSRANSARALETIQVLDGLVESVLDAESGQRGFILTGQDSYLAPFEEGRSEIVQQFVALREIMGDEPDADRLSTLDTLETASRAKFREMETTIELFRVGDVSGAIRMVNTDKGKSEMDVIRQTSTQLIAEEYEIMTEGRDAAQRARLLVLLCMIVLSVVSLFGFALALRNLRRAQKLGLVEEQARQLSEERERSDLLARELNHRVKNLFAIVQSIISSTARRETDVREAAKKIRERIFALSRAHSLTSTVDMQQQTTLAALVEAIVSSQVSDHCTLHVDGPEVTVMAQHVTPLGMILHELTTNAVKYGAGSCDNGQINVTWTIDPESVGQELKISWQELCAKEVDLSSPGPDGFGSRMMAISLSQVRGQSKRTWAPEGLHMEILLPLDHHGAVKDRNKPEN